MADAREPDGSVPRIGPIACLKRAREIVNSTEPIQRVGQHGMSAVPGSGLAVSRCGTIENHDMCHDMCVDTALRDVARKGHGVSGESSRPGTS